MEKLIGWKLFQISPRSGVMGYTPLPIPGALNRYYSPLTRLFQRPECREVFTPANEAWQISNAHSPVDVQWRLILSAVRDFIEVNIAELKLEDLALAWSSRVRGRLSSELLQTLYRSGLVFPELRDLDGCSTIGVGSPVAGAVGAYLDGVALTLLDRNSGVGRALFEAILDAARSDRRLPIDVIPDLTQLTSWLALVISVHEGSVEVATSIINDVAKADANIALDLHGVRSEVTKARPSQHEIVSMFLKHCHSHGNVVPLPFDGPLDSCGYPIGSSIGGILDVEESRQLIRSIPDVDVMSTVLVSCAVQAGCELDSVLESVVPTEVQKRLLEIRDIHRKSAIELWDPTCSRYFYASVQPVTINDLKPIFPDIDRCHKIGERTALLPWLSAHVVARCCGGDLPSEHQFRMLAEIKEIKEAVIADFIPSSPMLPRFSVEWLSSIFPAGAIKGSEFTGERPRFFDRRVRRATWQQSEPGRNDVLGEMQDVWVTVRPDHEKLAACRILFS